MIARSMSRLVVQRPKEKRRACGVRGTEAADRMPAAMAAACARRSARPACCSASAKSLRDLRVAEVGKLDVKIDGGKVVAYRARVSMSFKYED